MDTLIYFNNDGHLNEAGLQAAVTGCGSELTRLEIAEHLSFCDECLMRYTDILMQDTNQLMSPPATLEDNIWRKIRKRAQVLFINRYGAAAAAAIITLGMWSMGVFAEIGERSLVPDNAVTVTQSFTKDFNIAASEFTNELGKTVTETINNLFNKLYK